MSTFQGCSGLTSISIGKGVKKIELSGFRKCSSLKVINIPDNVTELQQWAFAYCSALEKIYIGKNPNKFGSQVFAYCPEITDVYCYANCPPSGSNNIFYSSQIEYAILHVPADYMSWFSTEPWKSFKDIVALTDSDIPPTGIIEKISESKNECFYDLYGRRVDNPHKGLFIVNGKKVVVK